MNRCAALILTMVAALVVLGLAPTQADAIGGWAMYRHDAQHTGRSPYFGPAAPDKKWETSAGPAAAVAGDGTVYVAGRESAGTLLALSPAGTKKWEFIVTGATVGIPVIGSDGTVYATFNDQLYAFTPTGTKKWHHTLERAAHECLTVGPDGTIYVGEAYAAEDGPDRLYAINPNGTRKWVFNPNVTGVTAPAIGIDGTVYASVGGTLYALNPNGSRKWQFVGGSGSPAVGSDGTIYVAGGAKLYAIRPNGTKKWEFRAGDYVQEPAIGADGTIYVGSEDTKLYALTPAGTKKWEFAASGRIWGAPSIGSDGVVYVGSVDNKLYAVNPNGIKKWEFAAVAPVSHSPAIGPDGTVYCGSGDQWSWGRLCALGSATSQVTNITIRTSSTAPRVGTQFTLSGLVTPTPDLVGKIIHVDVKKPGKSYWSYSSNRMIYAGTGGAASWQYKYMLVSGMARGTYYFKAVFEGGAGYRASASRILAISVR